MTKICLFFALIPMVAMAKSSHSVLDTLKTKMTTNETSLQTNVLFEFVCTDPMVNCAGHGVCISNGTVNYACKCDPGYNNFECGENVQCCYQQKKRVTMFLLSFFVGWTGAPYFVAGATGLGIGMLLLCVGGYCSYHCGKAFMASDSECCKTVSFVVSVSGGMAFTAAMLWSLVLWCMVAAGTETFKDSNNQPIARW